MKKLKEIFTYFLWVIWGVFTLFIYAYSELMYLTLICIVIISLVIYYRKPIIELYIEVFKELGITKYLKSTKDLKKSTNPIYKLISVLGLW